MKPHKHAEIIKKWADGVEIEVRNPKWDATWVSTTEPSWNESFEYRVKNRHQALIDAYNTGVEIEFSTNGKSWTKALYPSWHEEYDYRIKPQEPKMYTYTITSDDPLFETMIFKAGSGKSWTINVENK